MAESASEGYFIVKRSIGWHSIGKPVVGFEVYELGWEENTEKYKKNESCEWKGLGDDNDTTNV